MGRFRDEACENIANGLNTKAARKTLPQDLHQKAARKLDFTLNAIKLDDFKYPPGNHFEKLHRSDDEYSIRINEKYRIVFRWQDGRAMDVGIEDYH